MAAASTVHDTRSRRGPSPREFATRLFRDFLRPHSLAFVTVGVAALLSWSTLSLIGKVPIIFFILAVVVSAQRGIRTGVLATTMSVGVMLSVFGRSIAIPLATGSILALFVVLAIAINGVLYKIHVQNVALLKSNSVLRRVNEQLLAQAEFLAEANATLSEQKTALFSAHQQSLQLAREVATNTRTAQETTGSGINHQLIRWVPRPDGGPKRLRS